MPAIISRSLMYVMRPIAWLCLLIFLSAPEVSASRVSIDERTDPFLENARCIGHKYLSPPAIGEIEISLALVADNWSLANIWVCPESGYISYSFDFDLSGEEMQRLSEFLGQVEGIDFHGFTALDRLAWLETLYRIRGRGAIFWSSFYRAMYRNLEEIRRSHAAGRLIDNFRANRSELEDDPLELFGLSGVFVGIGWKKEACVCFLQGKKRFLSLLEKGDLSGDYGIAVFRVLTTVRDQVIEAVPLCSESKNPDPTNMSELLSNYRCGDVIVY